MLDKLILISPTPIFDTTSFDSNLQLIGGLATLSIIFLYLTISKIKTYRNLRYSPECYIHKDNSNSLIIRVKSSGSYNEQQIDLSKVTSIYLEKTNRGYVIDFTWKALTSSTYNEKEYTLNLFDDTKSKQLIKLLDILQNNGIPFSSNSKNRNNLVCLC